MTYKPERTKLCMIIGNPIGHSLSPVMHNKAYEALGIQDDFLYVAAPVAAERLAHAVQGARAINMRGIAVTAPHKETVMMYLDELDERALAIGAVNTIVNKDGMLYGHDTDWLGVVEPLEKITSLKNARVAVVGAGGAARAAVYGLKERGASVTVFNRNEEKADILARYFDCSAAGLEKLSAIKNVDIIINATTVGMAPREERSVIPREYLTENHIVFDMVTQPAKTTLLKAAKEVGAQVISGLDMLLYQGVHQFQLFTEHDAPVAAMRDALLEEVTGE